MTKTDRAIVLATLSRMLRDGEARRLRLAHGLSLRTVGGACGVSESCISRWELGSRLPLDGEAATLYADLLSRLLELEAQR